MSRRHRVWPGWALPNTPGIADPRQQWLVVDHEGNAAPRIFGSLADASTSADRMDYGDTTGADRCETTGGGRCTHRYHDRGVRTARCCLHAGHDGPHAYRCASRRCPGRPEPASERPHGGCS